MESGATEGSREERGIRKGEEQEQGGGGGALTKGGEQGSGQRAEK
jgi:hypothetical protein